MTSVLETLDWIVLGIYFLALIAVAVWVVLQKNKNTEDYFLAGRNVGWFVIGASFLLPILVLNMLLAWLVQDLNQVLPWLTTSCMRGSYSFLGGCFYPFILEAVLLQCQSFWKNDLIVDLGGFYLFSLFLHMC